MKKTYIKPETILIAMMRETAIMAQTEPQESRVKRRVGYEVSDLYSDPAAKALGGKVLPQDIWELSTFEGDPFGGHGQGTGGEGTRAGGFSLWED